ncbi:hypothetical protein [Streptomyces sp. NBC_01408]|uniref:hypothetical protein n=1 Tax=Streptomyces sp. NBC_01408 TaxID=2903855 RepID=UPI002259AF9B|nr:hypothetical protein [Streptomyces sp. NBC_01408]MCX4693678.1 hypothetical protein [Streptomyces sp. NBC_01408]
MSESSAPMRVLRAAIFAAVCVALGAAGHAAMSGADIPLPGLLGAFAVTGGLAWLGAGRRRGPVGITAALLAVQGVLHLVFSGSQAARPAHPPVAVPAPEPAHGPGHHHMPGMDMDAGAGALTGPAPDPAGIADMAGMADIAGMADLAGMAGMAGHGGAGHGGAGMIAAHVLAGLFCALWLARGEAAVFRLTRILGSAALLAARPLSRALALVGARVAAPLPPAPPASRPARERPRRLRGAVHAHAVVRRGPPVRGPRYRATAPGRPACA